MCWRQSAHGDKWGILLHLSLELNSCHTIFIHSKLLILILIFATIINYKPNFITNICVKPNALDAIHHFLTVLYVINH